MKREIDIYVPKHCKGKEVVLHILEPEPEGELGGADTHVYQLCIAQKKYSHYIPMVLINQNERYAKMLRQAEIAYINGTQLKHKKIDLISYVKDITSQYNIVCIHSHQYDANYITCALRICYPATWGKIPLIMTCHGWVEKTWKNKLKTALDFQCYKMANYLITVSTKDYKRLRERYPNKNVTCIHNGVECGELHISQKELELLYEKYLLPKDKKIIAYVGRLAVEKRVDLFLEAAADLLTRRNDVLFLVVGSGSEKENLMKQVNRLNINSNVIFTGFIEDIKLIYQLMDILVLSSDTEGTPRVVLEAMAQKKIVVATDVGGLFEIIDSDTNGYLAPKGDYKKISYYVNKLLDDDVLKKRLETNAQNTIKEKFSINSMQSKIQEVYDFCLKRGKRNDLLRENNTIM